MLFGPAASSVVTACISQTVVLSVTLQLREQNSEPSKGRILPNRSWDDQFSLLSRTDVVMIARRTTEQEKKTLQWSATLVT